MKQMESTGGEASYRTSNGKNKAVLSGCDYFEIIYFRRVRKMNVDKMKIVIQKGHEEKKWGLKMADGQNYYRMLFKFEKLKVLSFADVQKMFASFVNWKEQLDDMIAECRAENSEEDQKAIRYAEVLVEDILSHMHKIINDADKTEPANLIEELLKFADTTQQ